YANRLALDALFMEQLEVLLHLLLRVLEFLGIDALGDGEDEEERRGKDDAADGRDLFRCQIDQRRGQQHHEHREQSQRNLFAEDLQVRRHLPAALAFVFEAQYKHGKAVEGETPDHAECVGFTQHVHIAAAEQDGNDLQSDDQVDDAIAGAVFLLRLAEPVGKHSIFRDSIQYAIGADDGSVDRARQNQEAYDYNKGPEQQAHDQRPGEPHHQFGNEIVLITRDRHALRNDHHRQQRSYSGE